MELPIFTARHLSTEQTIPYQNFTGDAVFLKSSFRGETSFREAKFYANTWFSVAGDQKAEFYDKQYSLMQNLENIQISLR